MRTILVPILKNRTGDSSDRANYRPISLATTAAKELDSMLNANLAKIVDLHYSLGSEQGCPLRLPF